MDGKTFIVGPDKQGIDPNVVAMMNGGCGANAMWNNPFFYLIFLALFGRNGNLFGNNGCGDAQQLRTIQDTLNSQQTNGLVMDAIKGNACAIDGLATKLGCSADQITSAINGVNNMVTQMGYQNQLANMGQINAVEKNFAQTNYNLAEQACSIRQGAKDNTAAVIAKLDAIEDSRKDREIASLTAALTAANSRAERQAELAPIMQQLNAIKCAQPNTVTLPYSCATAVPTALAYQAGFYNNGNGQLWS